MPKNVQFIGTALLRCSISKPTQLVIGPGKTGKNEPRIPNIIKRNPKINRKISIYDNI